MKVETCPLRKNQVTWKQLSRDNDVNALKLNLSTVKNVKENNCVNKISSSEEIEIPLWMNHVRKLDQTYLIFNNVDKSLDKNLFNDIDDDDDEVMFDNSFLINNGNISEESMPFETSDSEFLDTSRTISVASPTKFTNSNSISENETLQSFRENQTQLTTSVLEGSKIENDFSKEFQIENEDLEETNLEIEKNFQKEEKNLLQENNFEFPIKTKYQFVEDLNEPMKKRKRIENYENNFLPTTTNSAIELKKTANKLENEIEKNLLFTDKLRANESVESIIMRTKNLRINDDSETEKNEFQYGKLENFPHERKLIEKNKQESNDEKNRKLENLAIAGIRTHPKKKNFTKKHSDKRLKILFKSEIPFQISTSNIQFYDQFFKSKKNRKETKSNDIYLIEKNLEKNLVDKKYNSSLSKIERKIQCNIDLLQSSTDSLISSLEETERNYNSDYCINETFIIEEIQKPRKDGEKYTLLPILENSINLPNNTRRRNYHEKSYWKRISRIPLHRLIESGKIEEFRERKIEKRNPGHYNLPFVAEKSR